MHDTLCSLREETKVVKKKTKKSREKKELWSTKKKLQQSRMSNARRRFGNLKETTKDLEPVLDRNFVPFPMVRFMRSIQNRSVHVESNDTNNMHNMFLEVLVESIIPLCIGIS